MNAKRLAAKIKKHGLPVISVTEGDELQDGAIQLTPKVHIQVPTFGRWYSVVKEEDGSFWFGSEHYSFEGMLADVRQTIAAS